MQQFEQLLRSHLAPVWRLGDDCFVAESPANAPARRLEIQLRADDDIDVCFFLEGVSGSPFEAHFVIFDAPPETAAKDVADFVDAILAEKLILVEMKGVLGGGGRLVQRTESYGGGRLKWAASWLGTYDRNL